ncbi:MAG: hydrogenase nickel incorporation protein HypB [Holophagaceae bacterium]|nr:hydrogenase nickel incorporation protein HypB [Holophagaceae bacterium]
MCTTCGCGQGEGRIEGDEHPHVHEDGGGTVHSHAHAHDHAQGPGQRRMVQIERNLLEKNDAFAKINREQFVQKGIFVLNLVSSPGSGKTTLLTATIDRLKPRIPIAVIEGDQQTTHDADRIRATGVPAIQINTGKGCHLDAHMVGHAAERLNLPQDSVLMIENVGNLVCPSAFDLGEAHKVVILSVTEGEDKPLKYPDMFAAADVLLLNKVDLLPYLEFDVDKCLDFARRVNPRLKVIRTSATTGEGLEAWVEWIEVGAHSAKVIRGEALSSPPCRA